MHAPDQQDNEADGLPGNRGDRGACHAQIEDKHQERVEPDIDDGPGKKSDHGIGCAALVAQLIVDYKLRDHEGSSDQNDPHIDQRIMDCRRPGTQRISQRRRKQIAKNRDDDSDDQRECETCRRRLGCLLFFPCAQKPGQERT